MRRFLMLLSVMAPLAAYVQAQSFEVSGIQDNYKAFIGETIKAPVRLRNTSDKPIFLVVRKVSAQIGGTQRHYYCIDNNCLDQRVEEYTFRLDPDQTWNSLHVALEAGLAQGHSSVKFHVVNKANSADAVEFELNFQIEEKAEKEHIYSSRHMTLYDLYPNPVSVDAFVDYKMYDDQIKAKIVIHNILGNPIDEYGLPFVEEQVKIRAETLSPGIYFYTLYIDGEGVITRKLIVKK
jgi:hypothetical protein